MAILSELSRLMLSQGTLMLVTVAAFEAGRRLQRWAGGTPLVHPVPIAIGLVIAYLALTGTPYDVYLRGTDLLVFVLGVAVVALALPLYDNLHRIRGAAPAVMAGVAAAAVTAAISAGLTAWAFGATPEVLQSLLAKSVTAGVAVGISQQIGGFPALTAVLTIATGILGAMLSGPIFRLCRVEDWEARGIATGSVSHAIGTAQLLTVSETGGAFAGLGIVLNALLTGIALPLAVRFLGF
jgi:predicted murein hydrolase (TIGR00659 family)